MNLHALPHGLAGIALHLTMLYLFTCIDIVQRSPSTLRPLKHLGGTGILCSISGSLAFWLVFVKSQEASTQPMLTSYLVVGAVLPQIVGVVALERAARPLGLRGQAQPSMMAALGVEKGRWFPVMFVEILVIVCMGLFYYGRGDVGSFILFALGALLGMGLVVALWPEAGVVCACRDRDRNSGFWAALIAWCINMVSFVLVATPFFMDCLLAVAVGDRGGAPMGESRKVWGFYIGYVVICLLPFFAS